ncbi:MAG: oligopeptidase B [Burkholderiales bacterium PBB3]|nr:MAG: oligopeptidase B [Burkholderiales bacterium PBB3]
MHTLTRLLKKTLITTAVSATGLILPLHALAQAPVATAPVAEPRPFLVTSPNGARPDPYYWLRDDTRKDPAMLAHLTAENAYFKAESGAYAALTDTLYEELVARIKKDDSTVPTKKGNYRYFTRFIPGGEYPIFVRTPVRGGKEQILIDGNLEAKGKNYSEIGARAISANEQLLAYLEDDSGRRQYTLKIRDLKTGKNLPDVVQGLSGSLAWANDNKSVYYVENDPVTLLSTRVKRHVLGTDAAKDELVFEEKDNTFYLGVNKSGDDRYVMIFSGATETTELQIIDAAKPGSKPQVFAPRERKLKYSADHIDGRWIIRTDWNAANYRLMSVTDKQVGNRDAWQELVPHNKDVFIEGFEAFNNFLAINERSEGLLRIRLMPWGNTHSKTAKSTFIQSEEPAYVARLSANPEQATDELRYTYTSLTTPASEYVVNMKTGVRKLLKTQAVLGGFDRSNYLTERTWAVARDGTRVPVSVVFRKDTPRNGTAPLYQYAYGSYGASSDPYFRSGILSLLDRGFVYAIAHIRGGQEMGRSWYENGKLLNKINTFTDYIDVTDHLVKSNYGAKNKVFGMGGSAGGLLMGAVANMAPDKYAGLIAHVPFVDVVTTMLDESIPLTTNEFDEWGNPKVQQYYDYMLSYSPYDNVRAKDYPAMLVTTGLHDSQVQYYEPAKWVAKLRATKTDKNPLLFKVNMEAGHGGKSGRFVRQRETAEEYGFILHQLGIQK